MKKKARYWLLLPLDEAEVLIDQVNKNTDVTIGLYEIDNKPVVYDNKVLINIKEDAINSVKAFKNASLFDFDDEEITEAIKQKAEEAFLGVK